MREICKTLILVLLLLIPGCSTKQGVSSEEALGQSTVHPSNQEIKLVVKPTRAKYIFSNAIEFNSDEKLLTTSKGNIKYFNIEMHGLKNKELESKLNNRIKEDMERYMKDYYENAYKKPDCFFSSAELNSNNLISIRISPENSRFELGLLYRITDGERIYLKDLFTEGTDYVSLINRNIVEQIIGDYMDEEYILRESFSTITPDQAFILSESYLFILFKKGEAGFADDYQIPIPRSKLDDYMDIFEKQQNMDSGIFEKPQEVLKHNNIFIDQKTDVGKTSYGNLNFSYPVISGIRDPDLENKINNIIESKANEFVETIKLNKQTAPTSNEAIGSINMDVVFNSYDYICILTSGFIGHSSSEFNDLFNSYAIDLKTGTLMDPKEMLISYANSNKGFKEAFTEAIKAELKERYNNSDAAMLTKIDKLIDFPFILKNGIIYFQGRYGSTQASIDVRFKENLISNFQEYTSASFYQDLNLSPEAFFK